MSPGEQEIPVYLLGEIAADIRIYTAKENHNLARHDTTDVFTKLIGVWKLRANQNRTHAEQP